MWMKIYISLKKGAKMKKIEIAKEKQDNSLFTIESYFFLECDSTVPSLPIYPMIFKTSMSSQLDVRFMLEDISGDIRFLLEAPVELTEYIKKHEENSPFSEVCLFHDLRTKYLDILECNNEEVKDNVILVGFTISEEVVYLAIKAFSMSGLAIFTEKVISYCKSKNMPIKLKNNVRWIQLEQCMLPSNNIRISDTFNTFLLKTLNNEYCNIFLEAFNIIDFHGYLNKIFYDKEVTINGYKNKIREINQFTKYFSPFWKADISVKETSRTVLYLHDELINDESITKIVYALKPHLMQYYQLHWFEDFCVNIIKKLNIPSFRILNIYAGRQFDFFQRGRTDDIREIDIIIGVEHEESFKIIAIECKKTLSDAEVRTTNKKIKNKILKSHTNIIDAFIHIGCFNNGVDFDKRIDDTEEKYKQSIIQLHDDPKAIDSPYYAFTISSIENLEMKMKYVLNHIFEQW